MLLLTLLLLKPAATVMCLGSGVPGGLCTPSLALGALLGGVPGHAWGWLGRAYRRAYLPWSVQLPYWRPPPMDPFRRCC
jgi:H+/Cl- antiporter ClcA